ncbi:MAG: hypothetical protein IJ773_14480 [Lachnospiraceae bacterium]|nr:hypothetical protein [Lachnospiraceae bacterium]
MRTIQVNTMIREPLQGHTSKGDQPKWRYRNEWFKADHMGYEALAEIVISRLLEKSNVKDFDEYVLYDPVWIDDGSEKLPGCASRNFRGKNDMLIPFERLHRTFNGRGLAQTISGMETEKKISYTVNFVEQTTHLPIQAALTMLLELDAFFLNEDRHTNNLAVIRDEQTHKFRLSPVFDNGLALLSDLHDYPLGQDIYPCISRVEAKPFHTDFYEQISAAERLYGPQLRLSFTRQDVVKALSGLDTLYPDEVLVRVETILYEQMRKYSYLFTR